MLVFWRPCNGHVPLHKLRTATHVCPHTRLQIVLSNWVAEFKKWLPTMPASLPGLSKSKVNFFLLFLPCMA